MPCQLQTDCLYIILEYLEEDKITLHSCLLVNRLWCKISVRILWRNIWNFKYSVIYKRRPGVASAILSTLIACLPKESKELLYNYRIHISTPTPNPPLFNYAAFCEVLPINEIGQIIIDHVLNFSNRAPVTSPRLRDSNSLIGENMLITREIIKMFVRQIPSLKVLSIHYHSLMTCITSVPEARNCLAYLSELQCSSDKRYSDFLSELSNICRNLQSLTIVFETYDVANGLKNLIDSQHNLKYLNLLAYERNDWASITPALANHSKALTKLHLYSDSVDLPLSFISSFSNLQEIQISFDYGINFVDFDEVQYVSLPKLQIFKMFGQCPKPEHIIQFLEINGKNLKEFYTYEKDNALNLSIVKFCPNLRNLFVLFNHDELYILKNLFNSCQYLESMKIWCGKMYLNEKDVLKAVAKYSPSNFNELKLYNNANSETSQEDLESFLMSWKNRSKKSLNLIIIKDFCYDNLVNVENMKIIKKYKDLGIIKKFEVMNFNNHTLYI